ncbi:MAG: hypothetical protein U1E73_14220 [Planctomycetota bacterium]
MRVFVTGISSFVGVRLARSFAAAGHEVRGSARAPERLPAALRDLRIERWSLDEPMPAALLAGTDVLVHCAYVLGPDPRGHNLTGTRAALAAGEVAGVARQLFVSSFSAVPDAVSAYGRSKFELEQEFFAAGHGVVRPGLVIGPGGLFARFVQTTRRFPCVPLPDGGRRPVPLIGHDDLAACVLALATGPVVRAANLCYTHRPALRDVVLAIARGLRLRRAIAPLPTALMLPPLRLLAALRLGSPVTVDSIRAYRVNAEDQHATDFPAFGLGEPDLDTVVGAALAAMAAADWR